MNPESSFAKAVLDRVEPQREFTPQAYYNPDGDCIEFLVSNESFWAERVDPLVTVYYGRESKEIIGCLIKGVAKYLKKILKDRPAFRIVIQDRRIRLEHIFLSQLLVTGHRESQPLTITYQKLFQLAEENQAEAELAGSVNV